MNEKITFPRLSAMLADRSGRSKRFSEDFLREFFALISETLETGESVKIKGLGTFRLSRVEPRKSIDVTTGQPMEISGHSKVVFVPAKELAEAVNAPFEAFTAIEINDDADISQLFTQDDIALQDSQDFYSEDSGLTECSSDIDQTETNTLNEMQEVTEKSEGPEILMGFEATGHPEKPEESIETEDPDAIEGSGQIEESEAQQESNGNGEIAAIEEPEDSTEETNANEADDEEGEDYDNPVSQKSRRNKWKKILIVSFGAALFALIVTLAVWYVFANNDFNRFFNRTAAISTQQPSKGDLEGKETVISETTAITDTTAPEDTAIETAPTTTEETDVPTAPSDALVYDTVSTTRYLTTIAKTHYGNYNLWPYIYEENKAILGHPDRIRPGTPVVVPKLRKYGIDPSRKEDIEKAKQMGVEIYARYGKKI